MFSGAAGLWGDRQNHYYDVGTEEQLSRTLVDAGYASSCEFVSAAVLFVRVSSCFVSGSGSVYESLRLNGTSQVKSMNGKCRGQQGRSQLKRARNELGVLANLKCGSDCEVYFRGKNYAAKVVSRGSGYFFFVCYAQ